MTPLESLVREVVYDIGADRPFGTLMNAVRDKAEIDGMVELLVPDLELEAVIANELMRLAFELVVSRRFPYLAPAYDDEAAVLVYGPLIPRSFYDEPKPVKRPRDLVANFQKKLPELLAENPFPFERLGAPTVQPDIETPWLFIWEMPALMKKDSSK